MNRNIKYKSKELLEIYKHDRQKWDEFYPSERWVFEKIGGNNRVLGDVLDVGCACGGLGVALTQEFMLNSYTGVDINEDAVIWARKERKLPVSATFIARDIIEMQPCEQYDTVVSLSCADWNVETGRIIDACWKRVRSGGYFVLSLRLSPGKGINNIKTSYQRISMPGSEKGSEVANYAVFAFKEAMEMIGRLSPLPDSAGAYGYWGRPSPSAFTPFERLVFAVFYIKKGSDDPDSAKEMKTEFDLPLDIFR